jgi:hypothetical protein
VALMLRNDFAIFEVNIAAGQLGAYAVPNASTDQGGAKRRGSGKSSLSRTQSRWVCATTRLWAFKNHFHRKLVGRGR